MEEEDKIVEQSGTTEVQGDAPTPQSVGGLVAPTLPKQITIEMA